MGPCGNDQRRPGDAAGLARRDVIRCRRPATPRARTADPGIRRQRTPRPPVTPCARTTDPGHATDAPHPHPSLRVCGQLPQVSVAKAPCRPPTAPYARATKPGLRRQRIPPPPATPYARATEPARRRERASNSEYGPSATDRAFRCVLERLGTRIQQAIATDGDIPRGRVRVVPGWGIRRRPGQQARPRTRRMSPHRRQKRPGRLSPPALTDQGWAAPIPAALRARRGPPGAPGYGHRPAPAHCAGGP